MEEELGALEKTGTWDLVELPQGKSVVDCKWVYKIKTKSDGSVKARLVSKGFTQEHETDYEEIFAPVACMTSVRTLIGVASIRGWSLSQLDVKNDFLNGDLHEEDYMKPPPVYYVSLIKFASFEEHFMVSNKRHMLGLRNSVKLLLVLDSCQVPMIMLCLFVKQIKVL